MGDEYNCPQCYDFIYGIFQLANNSQPTTQRAIEADTDIERGTDVYWGDTHAHTSAITYLHIYNCRLKIEIISSLPSKPK